VKIICIGRNYSDHIKELSNTKPADPVVFLKPDSSIIAKNQNFIIPSFSNEIHHEVELVVKINKVGKHIDESFSNKYYDEIGLGIDFTARDIQNNLKEKGKEQPYFWVWYPSIREILHKEMVYNDKNNANRISFDQLLISRRFNSYIYKEDNVYGNRAISDYKKPGLQSILESERIKKEILDFELDMWNR